MKRALLAGLIGFAAVTSSYGQGHIWFDNYNSSSYQQVRWVNNPTLLGSLAGQPVTDTNVEFQLFWAIGTYPNEAAFFASANAGVTTFINRLDDGFNGGGYYDGPIQELTGWVSGDTVTFAVKAWDTAGPYGGATFASSGSAGISDMWTETAAASPGGMYGITPDSDPAGYFENGPPEMIMGPLPEPSAFALSSLGAAALFLTRRRVASR